MAENPVEKVVDAPAQVASFAKRNPWAFAALVVVGGILVLRYQDKVKIFLVELPLVGKFFAKAIG